MGRRRDLLPFDHIQRVWVRRSADCCRSTTTLDPEDNRKWPRSTVTLKQAQDFIEEWRQRLCPEWEIEVKEGIDSEYARKDVYASVDPKGDGWYLRAILYLGETVEDKTTTDLDDRNRKRVLLHELLHLSLNDLDKAAREIAKAGGQKELAESVIDWQVERTVDRLAVALTEFA